MQVLINSAAEVTSQEVVLADHEATVEFIASGLGAYEHVQVQVKVDGDWLNLVSAGRPLLTSYNNFTTVTGRQIIRLYKPATVGIVKVAIVAESSNFSLN